MLDPSIWTDEAVMALSDRALIVYIGLISHADDEGIFKTSPKVLFHQLARDSFTQQTIAEDLVEIAESGLVVVYGDCGFHPNWYKYQSLTGRHPVETKLTRPPRDALRACAQYVEEWKRTFGKKDEPKDYPWSSCAAVVQHECSSCDPEVKGSEVKGSEGVQTLSPESPEPEPEPNPARNHPPHKLWTLDWYRRFTEETGRPVSPTTEDVMLAGQVMSERGLELPVALATAEAYFDNSYAWWFTKGKKTGQHTYSFRGYLSRIEDILSGMKPARAGPKRKVYVCPACGREDRTTMAFCPDCNLDKADAGNPAAVEEAKREYDARRAAQAQ